MSKNTIIHGFRVLDLGQLTAGFRRALRRLSERGFADESCVIIKTDPGRHSGITHAGGRYIDTHDPYAGEVEQRMKAQGVTPPPRPFILAPGEITLYHEWGHYLPTLLM